jgi:peptidoglycan hydrolase-like protein with peptidoglycan-binding domain
MPKTASILLAALALAACGSTDATDDGRPQQTSSLDTEDKDGADSMASRDPSTGEAYKTDTPDTVNRPVMQMQVVLERLGFGPGIVDGKQGPSLVNALKGFQESRDLPVTGTLDEATTQALARWSNIPATRLVTIPQSWADIKFAAIPEDAAQQAEMSRLGYKDIAEKLAERFHTTPEVLAQLNPDGRPATTTDKASEAALAEPYASDASRPNGASPIYSPGQKLRVPNVGADHLEAALVDNKDWLETLRSLGVGTDQIKASRIVVDESEGWLKAYDEQDQLVAMYTVTTGSQNDPLPLGNWGVTGVAYNPPFAFDPELFWDVPNSADKQQLPPGPNGPVGVVWIDLTK